jgi:hypothetical protein
MADTDLYPVAVLIDELKARAQRAGGCAAARQHVLYKQP